MFSVTIKVQRQLLHGPLKASGPWCIASVAPLTHRPRCVSVIFPFLIDSPPLLPDMSIFGLYPGHDDFYLVVCSHCGQVVKPQAFEKHCERRHGSLAKLYARLRSPTPAPQPQPKPHHGHSPSHGTNTASASSWESRGQGGGQLRVAPPSPSTPPQYRHSKNSKDGVR